MELLSSIPGYVCDAFGLNAAAMFLPKRKEVYRTDAENPELNQEQLEAVSGRGELVVDEQRQLCFVPLRIGVRPVGSLGFTRRNPVPRDVGSRRQSGGDLY